MDNERTSVENVSKRFEAFRDIDGHISSKRVTGITAVISALAMAWVAMFRTPEHAVAIINAVLLAAVGLLGAGVAERFGNRHQ